MVRGPELWKQKQELESCSYIYNFIIVYFAVNKNQQKPVASFKGLLTKINIVLEYACMVHTNYKDFEENNEKQF